MDREQLGQLLSAWVLERGLVGHPDWIAATITNAHDGLRPLRPDDLNDLIDRLSDRGETTRAA